jgi:hypothetical protein
VVVDEVPVIDPGHRIGLDLSAARLWRAPPMPAPADPDLIAAACDAVLPHMWNDPRALALGAGLRAGAARELVGRGPGLTPAGDDALAGYVLARRATAPGAWRIEAAEIMRAARGATGEPSWSLLRAAVAGEAFEPALLMLAALIRADGTALAPAVRRLRALGATTGRAMLTGMVCGLRAPVATAG